MNTLHAGDIIENRVTGERLVFRETSRENGGRRVLFDTFVEPGGFVAAAHVHPFQVEQFEVVSGRLGMQLAHESLELEPGGEVAVLNGTPHRFWNAGEDELHFRVNISPALQFESLLTTMFALAEDGKTNGRGMPNPLRLAVIAQAHFDTVRLPSPPVLMQRLGLAVAAVLGRLLGYKPMYAAKPAARDSQAA